MDGSILDSTLLPHDRLLFAGSLGVAVVLATSLGLALAWLVRTRPAPVRYGLLLSALSVAVLSPLLVTVSRSAGLGYLQIETPAAPTTPPAQPAVIYESVDGDPTLLLAPSTEPPVRPPFPWVRATLTALCGVWVAGAFFALVRLAHGIVRLRRFMLTLEPCEDRAALAVLKRSAELMGLYRTPRLCVSDALPVPMVMGPFDPVVVIPRETLGSLTPAQFEAVILHETAHVAHGDLWIGLFQRLAGALLWWCPMAHALNQRISEIREDICDNYVLNVQGDGLQLARVLVDLAESVRARRWPTPVGAMGAIDERSGLEGRISRLLQQRRNTMTRMNRAALLGTACFGLTIGGTILATTLRAAEPKPEAPADPSADVTDVAVEKPGDPAETAAVADSFFFKTESARPDSPADKMLAADDFWDTVGAKRKHDFDAEVIKAIVGVKSDEQAPTIWRLRAAKLACDLEGNVRVFEGVDEQVAERATRSAWKHLESNLRHDVIRKFAPQNGITHMGVALKPEEPGTVWVLLEAMDKPPLRGLNIAVDTKQDYAVISVKHWGKEPPAENVASANYRPGSAAPVEEVRKATPAREDESPAIAANVTHTVAAGGPVADPTHLKVMRGMPMTETEIVAGKPAGKDTLTFTPARRVLLLAEPAGEAKNVDSYDAIIVVEQADDDKTLTTLRSVVNGELKKPARAVLSGKLRQNIEVNITPVVQETPRQFLAEFRVVEGDAVISAPKLVVLEDRAAAFELSQGKDAKLTIELLIRVADRKPAAGAAMEFRNEAMVDSPPGMHPPRMPAAGGMPPGGIPPRATPPGVKPPRVVETRPAPGVETTPAVPGMPATPPVAARPPTGTTRSAPSSPPQKTPKPPTVVTPSPGPKVDTTSPRPDRSADSESASVYRKLRDHFNVKPAEKPGTTPRVDPVRPGAETGSYGTSSELADAVRKDIDESVASRRDKSRSMPTERTATYDVRKAEVALMRATLRAKLLDVEGDDKLRRQVERELAALDVKEAQLELEMAKIRAEVGR